MMNTTATCIALYARADPIPVATATTDARTIHIHDVLPLEQLITDVAKTQTHVPLNHGCCLNVRCKYCTGGLVDQRFHLVSRLVRLERVLFQDGETNVIRQQIHRCF